MEKQKIDETEKNEPTLEMYQNKLVEMQLEAIKDTGDFVNEFARCCDCIDEYTRLIEEKMDALIANDQASDEFDPPFDYYASYVLAEVPEEPYRCEFKIPIKDSNPPLTALITASADDFFVKVYYTPASEEEKKLERRGFDFMRDQNMPDSFPAKAMESDMYIFSATSEKIFAYEVHFKNKAGFAERFKDLFFTYFYLENESLYDNSEKFQKKLKTFCRKHQSKKLPFIVDGDTVAIPLLRILTNRSFREDFGKLLDIKGLESPYSDSDIRFKRHEK